jgi:hypothetical protein
MQKTVHFYTFFQNTHFKRDSSQTEYFARHYKTLMYAFGKRNGRGVGGKYGHDEGNPCFGAWFFSPDGADQVPVTGQIIPSLTWKF